MVKLVYIKEYIMKMWSIYKWKPYSTYPSEVYMFVNPQDIIEHTREKVPVGYKKSCDTSCLVGLTIKDAKIFLKDAGFNNQIKKYRVAINDEENYLIQNRVLLI
jgi:hypothetical protein